MTSKTITRSQYLQLLGLKTLAEQHNRKLEDIIQAVADIVDGRGEKGDIDGNVDDMVYSSVIGVDDLLQKLEISIADEPLPPSTGNDPQAFQSPL